MQGETLNEMIEVVVTWAKEQGKKYPDGLDKTKVQSLACSQLIEETYPSEVCEFLGTIKTEIAQMKDSFLRKFENALLHVPGERGFTRGQISMLNAIRSAVFIEIEKRQKKSDNKPVEKGE